MIKDPTALHDMAPAVDRLMQAIEAGELITVYGDYDADGITSTALMVETLETVGANVNYYVPDRFKDGYGPNQAAYQRLIEAGTQLILTVDNGVSGQEAIAYANAQGVDVVITDHHSLPAELPEAVAIVHPQYPGDRLQHPSVHRRGVQQGQRGPAPVQREHRWDQTHLHQPVQSGAHGAGFPWPGPDQWL